VIRTTARSTMAVIAALSLVVLGGRTESHAQPGPFPDLGSYTPVNVADYSIEIPNPGRGSSNAVFFPTPDRNACTLVDAVAECTGNNFPGIAPNPETSPQGVRGQNAIATDTGLQQTGTPVGSGDNTVQGNPIRPLPALHSITVNGATCGVDNTSTTACKDSQGRGFIISPHGTVWPPHV
jgi:hypothetical protein